MVVIAVPLATHYADSSAVKILHKKIDPVLRPRKRFVENHASVRIVLVERMWMFASAKLLVEINVAMKMRNFAS